MDSLYPTIDNNTCDGCGICADHCPTKILTKEQYGMAFVPRQGESCLYCGDCEESCPKAAIKCPMTIRVV